MVISSTERRSCLEEKHNRRRRGRREQRGREEKEEKEILMSAWKALSVPSPSPPSTSPYSVTARWRATEGGHKR